MKYRQCTALLVTTGRPELSLRCRNFHGHKNGGGWDHNFTGIGPYTCGMTPESYIRAGKTLVPWWRLLLWTLAPNLGLKKWRKADARCKQRTNTVEALLKGNNYDNTNPRGDIGQG